MPGFMTAPPAATVNMLWTGYGMLNGPVTVPKARLWLIADSTAPDSRVVASYGENGVHGTLLRHELGEVASVNPSGRGVTVRLVDGRTVSLVSAPCVCGAGAVGHGAPVDGRHRITNLNPTMFDVWSAS